MELVRRNSDYALRSLIFMAKFPIGKKFTVNIIAKKQRVPAPFLKKIFQRLSLNRILGSQRGPRGGFYLLKKPSQIRLREVLEVVQGQISLSDCLFDTRFCSRTKTCRVKPGLADVQKKLTSLLDKYTLRDFLYEKNYP